MAQKTTVGMLFFLFCSSGSRRRPSYSSLWSRPRRESCTAVVVLFLFQILLSRCQRQRQEGTALHKNKRTTLLSDFQFFLAACLNISDEAACCCHRRRRRRRRRRSLMLLNGNNTRSSASLAADRKVTRPWRRLRNAHKRRGTTDE